MTRPLCRHCGLKFVVRPRGLCWKCYYTPGVIELYPITSKHGMRGSGLGNGGRVLPKEPTRAWPGTEERVRVYEERAAAGESLFHPEDVVIERKVGGVKVRTKPAKYGRVSRAVASRLWWDASADDAARVLEG